MTADTFSPDIATVRPSRPPGQRLRRGAAKLELLVWMLRPGFYSFGVFLGFAAWQAAPEPVWWPRMLAAVGVAVLLRGATNVLNDLLDRTADRVTAPYQPMAIGAVSPVDAGLWIVALAAASLGLGAVAAGLEGLAIAACAAAGALGSTVLYSALKRTWWPNFLLFIPATLYLVAPLGLLVGLELASGEGALFIGFSLLIALATGVMTTLYDSERDGDAGARTVATRLGAVAAFRLLAVFLAAAAGVVVALALSDPGRRWAGLVTLAAGGLLYGRQLAAAVAVLRAKDEGPREDRRTALGPLAGLIHFVLTAYAACYWLWAFPLALASVPIFLLQRKVYLARVVRGPLTRRALGR